MRIGNQKIKNFNRKESTWSYICVFKIWPASLGRDWTRDPLLYANTELYMLLNTYCIKCANILKHLVRKFELADGESTAANLI